MKEQNSIYEMNDRELRSYKRILRLRRERRQKTIRFCVTVIATFCMILVLAASYGTIKSNANSGFKYYTKVTVKAGESLWDIADEYIDYDVYESKNSYIAEVKRMNHLEDSDDIMAGQTLIVPYYSTEYVY